MTRLPVLRTWVWEGRLSIRRSALERMRYESLRAHYGVSRIYLIHSKEYAMISSLSAYWTCLHGYICMRSLLSGSFQKLSAPVSFGELSLAGASP